MIIDSNDNDWSYQLRKSELLLFLLSIVGFVKKL